MTILLSQVVMTPALRIAALLQAVFLVSCAFLLFVEGRGFHPAASSLLTPASGSEVIAVASAWGPTDPRRGN